MHKFTKIVESQQGAQAYSYQATVKLEGVVYAENQEAASRIVEGKLGKIDSASSWEVDDVAPGAAAPILESAGTTAEQPARVYGAGSYAGPANAQYDRWRVHFSGSACNEMLVPRYLQLDPALPYVFGAEPGDAYAVPVNNARLAFS
jgi:hypothetical protein